MDSLRAAHQSALTRQESAALLEKKNLREQVQLLRSELEKRK
jgi:hypothetical protein